MSLVSIPENKPRRYTYRSEVASATTQFVVSRTAKLSEKLPMNPEQSSWPWLELHLHNPVEWSQHPFPLQFPGQAFLTVRGQKKDGGGQKSKVGKDTRAHRGESSTSIAVQSFQEGENLHHAVGQENVSFTKISKKNKKLEISYCRRCC